jgi:hypothetical protein
LGVESAPPADIRILKSGAPTSKVTPSLEAKEVCIDITPSERGGDDPTWTSMEVWEGELARTPSGARLQLALPIGAGSLPATPSGAGLQLAIPTEPDHYQRHPRGLGNRQHHPWGSVFYNSHLYG